MNILDSRLFGKILLLSVAVFALWSCSDDDEIIISSVEFNPAAVYITEYETSVDVKVTTKQSRSLSMNLVLFEGLALGFAKRISNRINNLYPNSLRIMNK